MDFTGWRYLEFELGGAGVGLDLARVEYLILFFNSLPSGRTVACTLDDIRALSESGLLRTPSVTVGGKRVSYPVSLGAGERLVAEGARYRVYTREGSLRQEARASGALPSLKPGSTPLVFGLAKPVPSDFRVKVSVTKLYGASDRR